MTPEFARSAGSIGKLYRQVRRSLPSDVRCQFAKVLLTIQPYFQPDTFVSAEVNIAAATPSVAALAGLLASLASCAPPPPGDAAVCRPLLSSDRATSLLDFVGAWSPLDPDAAEFVPLLSSD